MQNTGIKINRLAFYVNVATENAKLGSRGNALPLPTVYASMGKGERRRLRKQLHSAGYVRLASVRAEPIPF